MRRAPIVLALAAVMAALAALPAGAYQFLSQNVGAGVEPDRWPAAMLPINLVVDGGDPDLTAEITAAKDTWNGVSTARQVWGTVTRSAKDFTGANLLTDWGDLTGDGRYEVVLDTDGSAMTALGFAPGSINGFGTQHETVSGGQAVIDDMFLLINGTGNPPFDRRSTEVHELGHTLGLGHSTVGWPLGKDGSLLPVLRQDVPTMHPFATDDNRRTLEADDRAALSELYPEPAFSTTTGTISGKVTRCGSGEPVLGANVRAISTGSPATQVSRVTGFDGRTDGSYEINGLPPGDYFVTVEPLAGDTEYFGRLSLYTDQINTDFLQEFFNAGEADCAHDTDPNTRDPEVVGAGAETPVDFHVDNPGLALVIDVTGSMGPELAGVKTGLETMISALEGQPHFPRTAIVTFKDEARIETVSDDPARLRQVIAGLTPQSTQDCPEASNAALMTAGRLLANGGKAVLATDAESLPTGPSRAAVDALYAEHGVRLSTLLSGSCAPISGRAAARAGERAAAALVGGEGPDINEVPDQLGNESAIRTFSEESLLSGGLFFLQPDLETGGPTAAQRYANTLANTAIAAVAPAVAAVAPTVLPRGTTVTVELTGSNTGFRPGSTLAVDAPGVSVDSVQVLSPTRVIARLTATASTAVGFHDVSVRTDRGDGTVETARGIGAVQVTDPPAGPTVLAVTPATLAAGTTQAVTISGGLTHFAATSHVAVSGAGVTATDVVAASATSLVARVTVAPGADVGLRSVTVTTGGEIAAETVPGPLLVTAAPPPLPRLTNATPASGARGTTVDVALTGAATAFGSTSRASVSGAGVQVLSTTVNGATSAVARLRIAGDAPLGFRDLKVRTGAQDATLLNGFEVTPGALPVTTPTPVATVSPQPHVPTTCVDRARPRASFQRVSVKRRKLTVRGRASDAGCAADISVAGRVARVELAISRKAGRRCRFVTGSGKLGKARKCSQPVWLRAKGGTGWSFAVKLPRGSYTVLVRARDGAGNLTARPAKRSVRVR